MRIYGFTFVELLVAATMMSVLFVGLGTHLRGGLTVWQRATTAGETLQRRRVALERIVRDLASLIVYDARLDAYGGDEEEEEKEALGQLPWPVFGKDQLAFYTVIGKTRRQAPAVQFVTYACEERDGETALWRTSQSVAQARFRSEEMTEELLLPDCKGLALRYAYAPTAEEAKTEMLVWDALWPDDPHQPLAVPRVVEVILETPEGVVRHLCPIMTGRLGVAAEEASP